MPDPITPPALPPPAFPPATPISAPRAAGHDPGQLKGEAAEGPATGNTGLHQLAQEFEAVFLAQMLKSVGLGRGVDGFDGGMGEAQMQSFLIDAKARAIAASGGIGLAETVFRYLAAKEGADGMDPAQ
ncbi:MAG: rod-binding protein [Rhodobacteraceae bacterium]|nr:rod-binding protein [Paracoccaceae bacterium]